MDQYVISLMNKYISISPAGAYRRYWRDLSKNHALADKSPCYVSRLSPPTFSLPPKIYPPPLSLLMVRTTEDLHLWKKIPPEHASPTWRTDGECYVFNVQRSPLIRLIVLFNSKGRRETTGKRDGTTVPWTTQITAQPAATGVPDVNPAARSPAVPAIAAVTS